MSRIITNGGGGVTSCLSVRLHDAIKYRVETGQFPDEIDSSNQFSVYKDISNQDVSKLVIGDYKPDNSLPIVPYNHGWQFGMYDEIQLNDLAKLANNVCPMSSLVGDKAYSFIQRLQHRTAVLYRGNDKCLDVPRTHYQAMIAMAEATGSRQFIVQTDENDFYNFFKSKFPDTIFFPEIPRINKDPDSYVMPKINKSGFCINFLAALKAISQADKLILNTGNTGIWTMFFRGNTREAWQVHGRNQQWRKLI